MEDRLIKILDELLDVQQFVIGGYSDRTVLLGMIDSAVLNNNLTVDLIDSKLSDAIGNIDSILTNFYQGK